MTINKERRVFRIGMEIAIDRIDYSQFMVREIDGQTVSDLKESIKKHGVLQPIIVFHNNKTDRFEVICGNHRLCAAKGIGLTTIPAIIRPIRNQTEAIILSLSENIQRLDMNPLKEGEIYSKLIDSPSYYSGIQIAEMVGKSVNYVDGRIRLWKNLHESVRPQIGKGLTLTNALSLAKLPKSKQIEVYDSIMDHILGLPGSTRTHKQGVGYGSKQSPYCTCKKCGAKHLRGVSVEQ